MRISPTAFSSSACVMPPHPSMPGPLLPSQALRRSPEPRRPRRRRRRSARCRARLSAPSRPRADPAPSSSPREPIAGRRVRTTSPGASLSIRHGPKRHVPSRRTSSYSRTARTPCAEVRRLRPVGRREELRERALERPRQPRALVREREEVPVGAGMQPPEQREDLLANEPALRVGVRRVDAERERVLLAVAHGLLAPELEQRPHDAVLARAP